MDYVAIALVGVVVGVLIKKSFENTRILELEKDRQELRRWKSTNEKIVEKEIKMEKILRNIRKIITEGRRTNKLHTFILLEIEAELLEEKEKANLNTNQSTKN